MRYRISAAIVISLAVLAIFVLSRMPAAPGVANNATETERSAALLARYFPARSQDTQGVRIVRSADGFAPIFDGKAEPQLNTPGSRWRNPAKPVLPTFPLAFNGPVRVRSGAADVSAVPEGASASAGEVLPDGSLIYRDAFPGCDVIYRCAALKTEEFIVVRDVAQSSGLRHNPEDCATFRWRLDLGVGERALSPRLTPMHTIELCDTQGVPRLRIDLPEGKGADGKLLRAGKELLYTLDGARLSLAADLRGAKLPVVIDPSWSSTGSMAVGRQLHTATLLDDGRVLVVGGVTSGASWLASCELYSLVDGTWASADNLANARGGHRSTKLQNGRVLVTGGFGGAGLHLASCEQYDSASNTWLTAGTMSIARTRHTTTMLSDGRVLAIGGQFDNSQDGTALCDVYSPSGNNWSAVAPLSILRYGHTAARVPDGRIIVAGGRDRGSSAGTNLTSCEAFDPATGFWTPTGSLNKPRVGEYYDDAALLKDGSLFVGPGFSTNNLTGETFDPQNNSWNLSGPLAALKNNSPMAFLRGA